MPVWTSFKTCVRLFFFLPLSVSRRSRVERKWAEREFGDDILWMSKGQLGLFVTTCRCLQLPSQQDATERNTLCPIVINSHVSLQFLILCDLWVIIGQLSFSWSILQYLDRSLSLSVIFIRVCRWAAPEKRLLMLLSSGGHLGVFGAMSVLHRAGF